MKSGSSAVMRAKLCVLAAAGLLVAAVVLFSGGTQSADASASGPSPSHTGAPGEDNCTSCHIEFPANSGNGSVTISGIPANYRPGQQIPVTVRTSMVGQTIYGFQLTAIDAFGRRAGTLSIPNAVPSRLQLIDGLVGGNTRTYVEHTVDGVIPQQFDYNQWTFTWTAPATRAGKVTFYMSGNASNSDGGVSGDYIYTTSKGSLAGSATSNFDADGLSDLSVYRPSTGVWYALNSGAGGGFQAVQFGVATDKIVPGDYDGDGVTDFAVWRPSTGVWYVQKSTGGYLISQFGSNGDIPVVGDYDGDLKSDLAVWRPSTGVWYALRSSNGTFDIRQFGVSTDKPAQADFDGDAKTDLAIYRPSTGDWYVWRSTDGGYTIQRFGLAEDRPVQSDYDGDGKADLAVWRPSTGVWYLQRSTAGFTALAFGQNGDRPAPTDFDGDGKTDVAVFRNGTWYVWRTTDNGYTIANFGSAGDIPVAAGLFAE